MRTDLKNRYDFVLFFDVKDGNPNGDPDSDNRPRIDIETDMGLITDVCLKRKVRNYIQVVKNSERPFDIFIKEKAILNNLIIEAHEQKEVKSKEKGEKTEAAREWMCRNYYDVRAFGAVMTTGLNAGQVRGPLQMTFARSIDPIATSEHCITRMAVTKDEDSIKQEGDNRTMGRKYTVPYGLYKAHGFVSAHLAAQTGFGEEDLGLFWDALKNMFEHDHSAARGMMCVRKLIVFKHDSALGNAPAHELFDRVLVRRIDDSLPPRSINDYNIVINRDGLPAGVELIEMV